MVEKIAQQSQAQLEQADAITTRRLGLWETYHRGLAGVEDQGKVRRPIIPPDRRQNGHLYHLLLPSVAERTAFIQRLGAKGIQSVFHYIPLHSSPFGRSIGRAVGDMTHTDDVSERLVRLPLWLGLEEHMDRVVADVIESLG